MLANLQTRLKQAGRWLPVFLLPFAAQAQALNYSATNALYVAGTYTDLGTTGTAIATANTDDANSAVQPIGFTFNYNGQSFTQFVLNTNGFLKLGATAPSATAMFLPEGTATNVDPFQSPDPADVNIVAPFNTDMTAGNGAGGAEYRVTTTGTGTNRICTIQWKNLSDKAATTATQYANFSFQVKLYETTNNIEFVYAAPTPSAAAASVRYTQTGLKGSGFNNGQFLQLSKTSGTAWSAATFSSAIVNNTLNTLNFRNNINPVAGATYRFTPGAAALLGNDECTGATPLTVAATCTPTTVTNANATGSGTTTSTCDASQTGPNPITSDIWYTVVVPANGAVKVTTSAVTGSPVDDTVLELYSGTCTGLTYIACNDDAGPADGFSSVAAYGQTPGATLYVRVWSWNSGNTGQFGLCATALPSLDAAVTGVFTLGTVSSAYGSPVTAQAIVNNAGAATLTNVPVTLTVTGATNYTSLLTIPTLAPGASVILTFSYPFTATSGTNTVTVTAAAAGDAVATNNAKTTTQTISALTQSHFATAPTFADGIGSGTANTLLLARYHVNSAAPVTSVTPTFFGAATATDTYQVVIYNANATTGLPGALLYTSATRIRPATTLNDPVTVPNISVTGDFFVGVKQLTKNNISLAFVTDSPLRPATFYFSLNGTAFNDLSTSALAPRLGINVGFGLATSTRNEALAATVSLYPNPAHQRFKLAVPAGSLDGAAASLINALGQVVQTRQLSLSAAGGIADFDVSRLAAGVYSLQLKSGNDLVVKRVVVE